MAKKFRDFESSRKFARNLGLKGQSEWHEYCKSGDKPNDIPSNPHRTYNNNEWNGYGDWLGTGRVANFNKQFRDFKSAREFVRKLGLKNNKEWREYSKSDNKPEDIPQSPDKTYKNKGWISYGDWLGTGNVASYNKQFRNFKSAREFVRKLGLKNNKEWNKYSKSDNKPEDIPQSPYKTYKNKGWTSWGDWLGTGNVATNNKQYRDFESAREFVRKLGLKNNKEWREYSKSDNKPDDIPRNPDTTYKNKGWIGMGDWLGTGSVANFNKQFRDFESAREFVRGLKLKGRKEWNEYCKSGDNPNDMPSHPEKIYEKKGWISWGDWLGTGNISNVSKSKQYLPFKDAREEARKIAKQYNIKNWKDWQNAVKNGLIPKNIPANPYTTYSKKKKRD